MVVSFFYFHLFKVMVTVCTYAQYFHVFLSSFLSLRYASGLRK